MARTTAEPSNPDAPVTRIRSGRTLPCISVSTGDRDPQDVLFTGAEADRWFERNRDSLVASPDDPVLRLLDLYQLYPPSVLEVGASNGYRLAALTSRHQCRAVAVEPSHAAITDGASRYPTVEFHHGTAQSIPLREPFDLVIVHFVFHWIARGDLDRAVNEVDRVVRPGGLLSVGDFLPMAPTRTPYHHRPDLPLFTYKQDYAAPFLGSGRYQMIALITGHYRGPLRIDIDDRDRAGTWLLRKIIRS